MDDRKKRDEFRTTSDIPIKDVYLPGDIADLHYEKDVGRPGETPYTRGIYPSMYREKQWTIRQFSGFSSPEETNKRFKYEHQMGSTGFSIAFDAVTENGIDSDDPRAHADIGAGGTPTNSFEDMERMFDGLPIDKVNTGVIGNPPASLPLSAMYFALAGKRGIPLERLGGTTQNDILKEYIAQKEWLFPVDKGVNLVVDTIQFCAQSPWGVR